MQNVYILSLTTENTLRVLQRISTIFSRNLINIQQLNVFDTHCEGVSHFTIVIHCDEVMVAKAVKQLKKVVELLDIHVSCQLPLDQEMKRIVIE